MFGCTSTRLQDALGDLGSRGRLDEETVTRATREIRLALLEADVDFEVVKEFVASVRERALGQDVLKGLEPGQQVVKIVHDELAALMGSSDSKLAFGRPPTVVLLCGLQGAGKTTAAAKLALYLRKHEKKNPGPRRRRPPATRRHRPARAARAPAAGARLPHRHRGRRRRRPPGRRPRRSRRAATS